MFSTKFTRVAAHRTPCAASSLPPCSSTTAAHRCTQSLTTRGPSHQRRHSSSKPQSPSDSSKAAPATKAAATEDATQAPASDHQRARGKKTARYNRFTNERGSKAKSDVADRFAGLPSVPGVQHMHESEIRLCSFFSLHRPLSLSTTIPPPSTTEHFNSIFESKPKPDIWVNGNSAERRPEQVIYTLHDMIEALENGVNGAQEDGITWETLQESSPRGDVKHLDGTPQRRTLEELIAFKHFKAPPPPQPFTAETGPERKKTLETKQAQAPKQKRYTATITFTESTYADGQRTFTASPSPIVPVVEDPSPRQTVSQPFLDRMRKRERAGIQVARQKMIDQRVHGQVAIRRAPSSRRIKMMLISVKRQRKLKMKKHKYKKLMKRTRNLRRRQDRA